MKNFVKGNFNESPYRLVCLVTHEAAYQGPDCRVSRIFQGYINDQLDTSHLHCRERSLMVVTEAIMLVRVIPHSSSPTLVLILVSKPHSIRWREPVLHSRLQTIRPHWGQERGVGISRKQFMHCRLDLVERR